MVGFGGGGGRRRPSCDMKVLLLQTVTHISSTQRAPTLQMVHLEPLQKHLEAYQSKQDFLDVQK